jgi:DNA-binding SARP family transcriptional activator
MLSPGCFRGDKIATLLWGDMPQPRARAGLRQALTAIRRALADVDVLAADVEIVAHVVSPNP